MPTKAPPKNAVTPKKTNKNLMVFTIFFGRTINNTVPTPSCKTVLMYTAIGKLNNGNTMVITVLNADAKKTLHLFTLMPQKRAVKKHIKLVITKLSIITNSIKTTIYKYMYTSYITQMLYINVEICKFSI